MKKEIYEFLLWRNAKSHSVVSSTLNKTGGDEDDGDDDDDLASRSDLFLVVCLKWLSPSAINMSVSVRCLFQQQWRLCLAKSIDLSACHSFHARSLRRKGDYSLLLFFVTFPARQVDYRLHFASRKESAGNSHHRKSLSLFRWKCYSSYHLQYWYIKRFPLTFLFARTQ